MTTVLAILTSGRKKGFTSGLLDSAIQGIREQQVEVDYVWLPKYDLKPCLACFNCTRDEQHLCKRQDDMGKGEEGELRKKVTSANGILLADPVYFWGATAFAHLFFERLYPFLWSGKLNGIPFASISCATNQGMMREATRNLCKWAFQMKMRYIGGLPVHVAYYDEALKQAHFLGGEVAHAAIEDANGRKGLTDEEAFLYYSDTPWRPLELYIDNVTLGSGSWQDSMPFRSLSEGRFRNPEAVKALEKCVQALKETIRHHHWQEGEAATRSLARMAAYWTTATWKEFLETGVIGTGKPEAYRSTDAFKSNE